MGITFCEDAFTPHTPKEIGNGKTTLFPSVCKVSNISSNIKAVLLHIPEEYTDIHSFIDPGISGSYINLFQYIKEKYLYDSNVYIFFINDITGFSPLQIETPIFDILYHNCNMYDINPDRIVYVSANVKDEENIKKYVNNKKLKPIHVFSFLTIEMKFKDFKFDLDASKSLSHEMYDNKYFLSLSRRNRDNRIICTFLLWSDVFLRDRALISHDTLDQPEEILFNFYSKRISIEPYSTYDKHGKETKYNVDWNVTLKKLCQYANISITNKQINQWINSLPLTLDEKDFSINWAHLGDWKTLHHKTLFSLALETRSNDHNNSSIFYTEKCLKSIASFQPFLIWGQKGCNKFLKELGYKTYEKYFDLDFDNEQDILIRCKKLLQSLKETSFELDSMTRKQQLDWKYKYEDILLHNFNNMINSTFTINKFNNFIKKL